LGAPLFPEVAYANTLHRSHSVNEFFTKRDEVKRLGNRFRLGFCAEDPAGNVNGVLIEADVLPRATSPGLGSSVFHFELTVCTTQDNRCTGNGNIASRPVQSNHRRALDVSASWKSPRFFLRCKPVT